MFSKQTILKSLNQSRYRLILLVGLNALILSGCSTQPIVDTQGVDMAQYNQDLQDCKAYAAQVNQGKQAGQSALFGALVGGAMGALSGHAGNGAAAGGVMGGASGALQGDQEKSQVLRNCLRNRGYTILN